MGTNHLTASMFRNGACRSSLKHKARIICKSKCQCSDIYWRKSALLSPIHRDLDIASSCQRRTKGQAEGCFTCKRFKMVEASPNDESLGSCLNSKEEKKAGFEGSGVQLLKENSAEIPETASSRYCIYAS